MTLRLRQQTTHRQVVFRVAVHVVGGGSFLYIGHLIITMLIGNKAFQTCLHVFVEALQQCQCKGVLDTGKLVFVVDGITRILTLIVQIVIGVGIIVLGRCISLVDAIVVVDVEGMDEASDGHVFALHVGLQAVLLVSHGQHAVQCLGRVNLDACAIALLWCYWCSRYRCITHNLRVSRTTSRSITCNLSFTATSWGLLVVVFLVFVVLGVLLG